MTAPTVRTAANALPMAVIQSAVVVAASRLALQRLGHIDTDHARPDALSKRATCSLSYLIELDPRQYRRQHDSEISAQLGRIGDAVGVARERRIAVSTHEYDVRSPIDELWATLPNTTNIIGSGSGSSSSGTSDPKTTSNETSISATMMMLASVGSRSGPRACWTAGTRNTGAEALATERFHDHLDTVRDHSILATER